MEHMNSQDQKLTLGVVPEKMRAYVIDCKEHGEPIDSFKERLVDVPKLGPNDVLIRVKAAGVNYNGVWAAMGKPLSPSLFHGKDFHIAGSDAAGIVWKIGEAVDRGSLSFKEGDEVIIHCGQYCGNCRQCNGGNPMLCPHQKIWGYETPYGSFADFTIVRPYQVLSKPAHLSWAEASSYMLVLGTVWRMLYGHPPHVLKPSQNILVWGGAGGLGSMAIQVINNAKANAIAVVSSEERGKFCLEIGAKAYINRNNFNCWGVMPKVGTEEYLAYLAQAKKFRKAIWAVIGVGNDLDMVIEHVGEQTFPLSCYLVKNGGMVVYCGATTGFNLTMDAAYGWMHQKRIQGSHFASTLEAFEANEAVKAGWVKPTLSRAFKWKELPMAHQLMMENKNPSGCMAVVLDE